MTFPSMAFPSTTFPSTPGLIPIFPFSQSEILWTVRGRNFTLPVGAVIAFSEVGETSTSTPYYGNGPQPLGFTPGTRQPSQFTVELFADAWWRSIKTIGVNDSLLTPLLSGEERVTWVFNLLSKGKKPFTHKFYCEDCRLISWSTNAESDSPDALRIVTVWQPLRIGTKK